MTLVSSTKEYLQLQKHHDKIKTLSLRRLFEENPHRVENFSQEVGGLYLDYSKNHITPETMVLLHQFAQSRQLPQAVQALINGEYVNHTEHRKALHTALRFQGSDKTEEQQLASNTQKKMATFVDKIHSKQCLGYTGKPIDTIINIGIGGSDLGPRMVVQALSTFKQNIDVKFVANVDGCDLSDTLENSDPETTLFIIASKTFSTLETLQNASSARQWILDKGCQQTQLQQHFAAISTNVTAAETFGIATENIFPLWDWVGGRYSLWSAIGLPIAIAIGMENFRQLLHGANSMDEHYANTDPTKNLPVISALLTFWYSHFWGSTSHAVLPYAQRLSRLPAFLQQLDMESLGKSVTRDGQSVNYPTGGVIWGTEGTNGQHSFHQLLHQGTQLIPVDFIAIKEPISDLTEQHQHLLACCISQSQALLKGKTLTDAEEELRQQGYCDSDIKMIAPHKVIAGNKPSNTLIMDTLTPENFGALLAFYEHKVHTLSVLLDINPFDQWGVELGKQLGKPIHTALTQGEPNAQWDESTQSLIRRLKNN